ncbi:MAG: hypothetical protein WC455_21930 [Dehalococcoidia bacterium]|jgi:hypothetical protein
MLACSSHKYCAACPTDYAWGRTWRVIKAIKAHKVNTIGQINALWDEFAQMSDAQRQRILDECGDELAQMGGSP